MWTYHAERLVPDEPSAVHAAVAELVAATWGDRSRTVLDGDERIDAIASSTSSSEPDVWLTWRTEARPDGTWLELQLDELERGPDPRGGLRTLLDALAVRLDRPPSVAGP